MTDNAIEVVNLSKMFKLYPSQGKRLIDYASFGKKHLYQEFWALRDISLTVPKGTTFGILGQNGSGKSTLLSILAGVLEPTSGSFMVSGKVSAILELGAGFHPEFTGRTNTYMYGSIMGLSKEDITLRLPDIIHFSELGEFIDQPLRTYSSGMYARLAFSVAVNVDADILIVDEALSVGDALFQHRCFRKIHELKESGKTILYVGHDTEAVRSLCDHAMILDAGKMLQIGDSAKISNQYLAMISEREQKYYETNVIESGRTPDENWECTYNFIEHLSHAEKKMVHTSYIREMNIEIGSIPRKTIFAHPPSDIQYSVVIPSNSMLSFAIGIYPSAYDFIPDGVQFRIFIDKQEIFSRILEPKKNPSDRGWHNQLIDMSEYAGKKVKIRFNTEGSGQDISYCWGGWGWVRLFTIREGTTFDSPATSSNRLRTDSRITTAISTPLNDKSQNNCVITGNRKVIVEEVIFKKTDGSLCNNFISGEKIIIEVIIHALQTVNEPFYVGTIIFNKNTRIAGSNTHLHNCDIPQINSGEKYKITFSYQCILRHGLYSITAAIGIITGVTTFQVIEYFHRVSDKYFFQITQDDMCDGIVDLCDGVFVEPIDKL
ncbi:ABC transporter ATP-binding protein [Methanospirillum sp. J.3.6.1-F.2.7.3]|uniref:ABC transporter ATP-binding protein n=1 Tax=Methanospirillum purgamenti TaxID=2834276 RepID=A0A8E7AX10_9EURY|nr:MULTISPECIES: ABC transporter ATP-binding protein [Methanospirillum]MDX8549476.1 ABC transporter ATP-binding protein [Methanospirillum hungatei]QVV89242.1 ABC transporter ATP-binding protein [Methanospirillum sp. J.3.6.1-F.2.7.3]